MSHSSTLERTRLVERRSLTRQYSDTLGPLSFQIVPELSSAVADVRDFSVQGIGLLVESPIAMGSELIFLQGRQGSRGSEELRAYVRHTSSRGDGEWLIGCSFSRRLTVDDLLALGKK